MKFTLEIELGNDAMQTGTDVIKALRDSLKGEEKLALDTGTAGRLWDENGNIVGKWEVTAEPAKPDSTAEILGALSSYASGKPIDLTPRGCTTPEGAARVSKALEAWNGSGHEVANLAAQFMDAWKKHYGFLPTALTDESEELQKAIKARAAKQEEFLRAVAGVQNPDSFDRESI